MSANVGDSMSLRAWHAGRVPVGPATIVGWLRDGDGLGAVFCCHGGNFGHPGHPGWVLFRDGEVVGVSFVHGVVPRPEHPPELALGIRAVRQREPEPEGARTTFRGLLTEG